MVRNLYYDVVIAGCGVAGLYTALSLPEDFVVNRFQIGKLKEIVREIDKKAYISITEVADVFSRKTIRCK